MGCRLDARRHCRSRLAVLLVAVCQCHPLGVQGRPGRGAGAGGTVPGMVTLDDVAGMALALPEVAEGERHGHRTWNVGTKTFAWERQFSKADVKRFGSDPVPEGPILAVRVADLDDKEAVLAEERRGFFTIPHFEGYAAVLIQLKLATKKLVQESIVDAWLACAPPAVADEYVARNPPR